MSNKIILSIILFVAMLLCSIAVLTTGIKLYRKDKYAPILYVSSAFALYIFLDCIDNLLKVIGVF